MMDALPRQFAARRGLSLAYQGKTLLSLIDPIGQAERAVDAKPKLSRTLYFCPSPLYGYGLERLLEQIDPDSAVLGVETDGKLMELSLHNLTPFLAAHPRFRLVRTQDPVSLCTFVRDTWGSRVFRRVSRVRLNGGWQLAPDRYDALEEALRKDMATDWGNAMTLVKLGRRYITNALRNLAHIPRSRNIKALTYGSQGVLVLGAGPSLDPLLPALIRHFGGLLGEEKRPFRIICVDTALQALRSWNIKPDLAVALESQHWNLRDFIGLRPWNIPAAMDLSALPATADVLGTKPYLFFTPWTQLRLFDRLGVAGLLPAALPPLGSVGLTAVSLARTLTQGPVITGGIDFSFFPDAFHARSTPGHEERLRLQNRIHPLIRGDTAYRRGSRQARSKNGILVRTDPVMQNYRDLFEREFSQDGRISDIIGSGLPLGSRLLDMAEGFRLLAESPPPPPDAKARPAIQPPESRIINSAERFQPRTSLPAMDTAAFIRRERETLERLRDMLTGTRAVQGPELEWLLDETDYLWAHFPECAGTEGRRPPASDISFLKRVRVEIDPAVKILDQGLAALAAPL